MRACCDEGSQGSWFRYDPRRQVLILQLRVQPNASRSEVAGLHGTSLKVRIAAPAVDHKANALLIDFLTKKLDLRAHAIMITHGLHARSKTIEIAKPDMELLSRISKLADE